MSSLIKYVDHTYRDFSNYEDEGGEMIKHKKSTNNFPARLHLMLSDDKNSDVITWMPHGRAWKVLDKDRLIHEVIPHYYKCKKYESFTRQLNGWGFKRLHQSGPDFGCYYQECFLRGLPNLTCLIRRLPPNLGKSTPFAEGEPNFYRISEQYPLPPNGTTPSLPPSTNLTPVHEVTTGAIVDISSRMRAASVGSVSAATTSTSPEVTHVAHRPGLPERHISEPAASSYANPAHSPGTYHYQGYNSAPQPSAYPASYYPGGQYYAPHQGQYPTTTGQGYPSNPYTTPAYGYGGPPVLHEVAPARPSLVEYSRSAPAAVVAGTPPVNCVSHDEIGCCNPPLANGGMAPSADKTHNPPVVSVQDGGGDGGRVGDSFEPIPIL